MIEQLKQVPSGTDGLPPAPLGQVLGPQTFFVKGWADGAGKEIRTGVEVHHGPACTNKWARFSEITKQTISLEDLSSAKFKGKSALKQTSQGKQRRCVTQRKSFSQEN